MTTTKHKTTDSTAQDVPKKRRGVVIAQVAAAAPEETSDDSAVSVSTMSITDEPSNTTTDAVVTVVPAATAVTGPAITVAPVVTVPVDPAPIVAAVDVADHTEAPVTRVPDTMVLTNPGWIPDSVMIRLRQIAMCADHFRYRQILASIVPADVSWGGHDQSFMVYRNQKVLTVAFVARLIRVTYFSRMGEPERCQQIKFRFFRDADANNARALVFGKSHPPQLSNKTTFWAGKRCSTWDEESRMFKPQLFDAVWDGTGRMRAKSKMRRLDITDLSRGDVVNIECNIHRYRVPTPEKGSNAAPWVDWRAAFQLSSITKLWAAIPAAQNEVESDAEAVAAETTDDEFEGL